MYWTCASSAFHTPTQIISRRGSRLQRFIRFAFISHSVKMGNTERLISFVRKYPILYNQRHSEYKNLRAKDKIWTEIGKEFNKSGNELKKRWKNLRDTYAKYIRTTRMKTGRDATKTKPWIWAELMEGFRPFLTHPKPHSNVSELTLEDVIGNENEGFEVENTHSHSENNAVENTENTDVQETTSNRSGAPHSTPAVSQQTNIATPTASKVILRKKKGKKIISPSPFIGDIIKYYENNRKKGYDAVDALMIAHAKTIKTFSARRQIITKMKIAQVIMEQELLHQRELNSPTQQ